MIYKKTDIYKKIDYNKGSVIDKVADYLHIIINTAQQNPVLFKDYISESEKTLSETEGITEEMVLEELKALNLLLVSAREKSYREVLEKKRATFSRIKEQQAKEANNFLSFGGNPNAHT